MQFHFLFSYISGLPSDFVVVESDDAKNDCKPDAYVLSEAECKLAAKKKSLTWDGTVDDDKKPFDPIACYRVDDNVRYNKATRGDSREGFRPLCGNRKMIMKAKLV